MARLLVRLKARLFLNGFLRGTQQTIGMLVATGFGLLGAVIGFSTLAAGSDATAWSERVVLVFAALWVAWLLLPMLTFSSDDTLDPRRFALLPVRPRALVPGLLAASFVGIGPIASALGASGAVVGAARHGRSGGVAVLVAVAAVVALLLVCLATSRAITTAASNLLATRRGRDVVALLSALLGIGVYFAFQALANLDFGVAIDLTPVVAVARWSPGGMAGVAIGHGIDGATLPALAWLAGLAGWVLIALVAWAAAMERIVVRQPTTSSSARTSTRTSLYPRGLGWLPRTRSTAVAMRFLRNLTRDVRVRTQAMQQVFVLFPMILVSGTSGGLTSEQGPLYAAMLAVPAGFIASNQLGLDGPALWQHELAGEAPRTDLAGRNLALTVVTLPLAIVGAVVLAGMTGGWSYVPAGLLLTLATLGVLFGVANVGSVLLPIPVAESSSTNVFGGTSSGQGCVNGLLVFVVILVMGVLSAPIMVAMLLIGGVAGRTIASLVAVGYGAAILWGGTRLAAARMAGRGPELLAAVDPGRGS